VKEPAARRRTVPIVLLPDSTALPLLALAVQLYWPFVRRLVLRRSG